MTGTYLVMGSWKIRHNEQLGCEDKALEFLSLPNFDTEAKFLEMGLDYFSLANNVIPLAIVSIYTGDCNCLAIIHNIRADKCLFTRLDNVEKCAETELVDKLVTLFDSLFLYSNNHECFYTKPHLNIWHQVLTFQSCKSYWSLGLKYFDSISKLNSPLYRVQYGKTYEHFRYLVDEFIYGNAEEQLSKVRVMHFAAQKRNWNSVRYTIEETLFDPHSHAIASRKEWEQESDDYVGKGVLLRKAVLKEGVIKILCESAHHSNVFDVSFVSSIDKINSDHNSYVSISYLKTRGVYKGESIASDFTNLVSSIACYLKESADKFPLA